jgi:hypothetical protein
VRRSRHDRAALHQLDGKRHLWRNIVKLRQEQRRADAISGDGTRGAAMSGTAFTGRSVPGTHLGYSSLAEWLELVYRIGGKIRCSQPHYTRCGRLYRSLRAGDIRSSRDIPALEGCERLFQRARGAGDIPCGRGLQRELTRAEIGALLVETRNRLDALRSGRANRPRPKGPRFDPARIPDAALERLIQRHPDLDTVDRLRAERNRRITIHPTPRG